MQKVSILALLAIFFVEGNCLGNCGRVPYVKHLGEIIFEIGSVVREMSLKVFFLFLAFCLAERNCLRNFGTRPYEKHLGIILK